MELESGAARSTGMIGFLTWVEVNKKRLLIGGGGALVALFLGILFIQHQAQKEATASQALSDIRVPFSAAGVIAPGTADALLKFSNEHRGTKAGGRALLLSAGVLFSEHTPNSYAEAQKRFAQVLQEYPTSPWVAEANLGVAKALLAQGKTNEATVKFEEVQKRFANSGILDEV